LAELVRLESVERAFHRRVGRQRVEVRAVDGVDLVVGAGESLGLVGESGSGKSTLARLVLRLLQPSRGRILFEGRDITHLGPRDLLAVRRRMQAVFQDPYASLNSTFTIERILAEPFAVHRIRPVGGVRRRVVELLEQVGLESGLIHRRPQQLSGGQLQRVAIARALALEPDFIVADEPTSALDVSVQAQIVNLFLDIQRRQGISYLFISHDLDLVGHVADRIAVMYLGVIVEEGPSGDIMRRPLHPYTQALISAEPVPDPAAQASRRRIILRGDPPSGGSIPIGCRFHPRCPVAQGICRTQVPSLRLVDGSSRRVACHLAPEGTEATGIAVGTARLAVRRPLRDSLSSTTPAAQRLGAPAGTTVIADGSSGTFPLRSREVVDDDES
jgi:oligopeptide/dipeptide ABC transporter ATP-binding protein